MVELSIIKYLLTYNNYIAYNKYLKPTDFPDELRIIYNCLCSHFGVHSTDLAVLDLANLVFSHNPKDKDYYNQVFKTLEEYTPVESTVKQLIESLKEKNLLEQLSISAYKVAEGKEDKEKFLALLELYNTRVPTTTEEYEFVTDDLEAIVNSTVTTSGLKWRLDCLNNSLGPLRKGDFGFIFARPEVGKTTWLCSEVSNFLPQVTGGGVLWLNNEEQGDKVMLRIYQAYFGATLEQLYGNIKYYRDLFKEQTGGKFHLYDSAKIDRYVVEGMCEKLVPTAIIIDQLDKIEGFKAERDDLLLGAKYQWARQLAKQYGPVIGVTQSDGSGEGVRYLTMAHVANAKTAKQAEADWILGIGVCPDPGWESIRFFNICKNKLIGSSTSDSSLRHGKFQSRINPTIGRYSDL